MEPIIIVKKVDEQTFKALPELAELVGQEVEITVKRVEIKSEARRRFGWAKGKVWMSSDFDEPLEEFREYM